eukprot:COSAG02_NODE_19411_length_883_cov_0.918367_1_plen_109_part_00
MSLACEALEGIMEEREELRIAMMKILSDRLFESYGRMNIITKIEQRRDYFTIFQHDLRLDVRNLRRLQHGGVGQGWDDDHNRGTTSSEEEEAAPVVDRSLSRFKRAQI